MSEPVIHKRPDNLTSAEKFAYDMAVGEGFENRFIAAVERDYGNRFSWRKHINCSGTKYHCKCWDWEDIASHERYTIECKQDYKQKLTGNLCLEAYILTDKLKADYWVHEYTNGEALWLRVEDLRRCLRMFIDADVCRLIKGGDGDRTEMYVVDRRLLMMNTPHLVLKLEERLPMNMFT